MIKSLNLTIKLPLEWQQKLNDLALEKQLSLEDLITEVIGEYLGYNLNHIKVDRLVQKYQDIDNRLGILETKDYQINSLENRLNILEKLVASLQSQVISHPTINTFDNNMIIDDEIYDEPDEILTDFLE